MALFSNEKPFDNVMEQLLYFIFLFGTEDIKKQFITTHKHNQAIIPQQNQIKTV